MRLLFLCAVLSSCADPIKSARITLTSISRIQAESVTSFKEYDLNHQLDIVKAATTKADGEKALAEYRTQRAVAAKALQGLYLANIAAEKSIALAEQGLDKKLSIASVVKDLFDLVDKAKDTLVKLGVPLGGLSWAK